MNTAQTAIDSSKSSRSTSAKQELPASADAFPPGLTLLLVLLVAFTAIVGVVFYLAGQMPV